MPGLKKSVTRRWRVKYGGDRSAEMELREAIAFLFALKGAEYKKLHPSFTVPTVDEFFEYARQSNNEIAAEIAATKKTKKTITSLRPLNVSSTRPQIAVHGGRRKSMVGGTHLEAFFRFIAPLVAVGSSPCDKMMLCLNLVLYAILAYKFTTVFVAQAALHPAAEMTREQFFEIIQLTVNDRGYANSFADPVRWFIEHVYSTLNDQRDSIMAALGTIVTQFTFFLLQALTLGTIAGYQSTDFAIVGTAIMSLVNLFLVSPFTFDSLIAMPLTCALARAGFTSCAENCRKLIEKLLRQTGMRRIADAGAGGDAGAGAGAGAGAR
jgi:hypothetical protein